MAANGKQPDTFYSGQFTSEEFALLAAFVASPTLDEAAWLERVLATRLGQPIDSAQLAKVGLALAIGADRAARFEQLKQDGAKVTP